MTNTLTVGVPLSEFAEKDLQEIKKSLHDNYIKFLMGCQLKEEVTEKIVNLTIRIDSEMADDIRQLAKAEKMSIIEFTSKLF